MRPIARSFSERKKIQLFQYNKDNINNSSSSNSSTTEDINDVNATPSTTATTDSTPMTTARLQNAIEMSTDGLAVLRKLHEQALMSINTFSSSVAHIDTHNTNASTYTQTCISTYVHTFTRCLGFYNN